ncbi:MAG: four-carbon acid sugar kinase family protein [Syntrophomonadaceae bacterium]|nr:four-carbon acid sugar kinase family protein [Syntrophomonadaceae bacterium]
MRISIIIIADDLTGANDSAAHFKKKGFSTIVKVFYDETQNIGCYNDYDIISINTDTRSMDKLQAYERIYAITQQLNTCYTNTLYKKIDSVLRGNPDSELEAIMDATASGLALVAPSYPINGRTVFKGIMHAANHHIDVLGLFSEGMNRNVEGISLSTVRKGPNKLAELIEFKLLHGGEVFVLDACTDEDLKMIKDAAEIIEQPKILCGSAGLAQQLNIENSDIQDKNYLSLQGNINGNQLALVAIGSYNKKTAHQVKFLSEFYKLPIIQLQSQQIISGNQKQAIHQCIKAVKQEVTAGNKIVILTVDSLFKNTFDVQNNNVMLNNYALLIAQAIASIVGQVHRLFGLTAIISSGGDTSFQICQSFGTPYIELLAEIMPGIPLGKMRGGQADSILIATKSGGFGKENSLVNVIEYLKEFTGFFY